MPLRICINFALKVSLLRKIFANTHFLLYLRTSALAFANSRVTPKSQFPRSYVRTMRYILQFARNYLQKWFALCHPLSTTSLSS